MDFTEVRREVVNYGGLTQDRTEWRTLVNAELNL